MKVEVIGIGDEGAKSLPDYLREKVDRAQLLIGGERLHEFFPQFRGERLLVKSNLAETANRISQALAEKKQVVVLASGDPLFYGIGKYLIGKLGKERVEIYPYLSSMQLAFAKVKESWQEAALVSLHAKPMADLLAALNEEKELIGVFTDDKNTPASIARFLVEKGFPRYRGWICENLGGEEERIREMSLAEMEQTKSAPLNVVILKKEDEKNGQEPKAMPRFGVVGIPDDAFIYRSPKAGLITKMEIRAVSLAKLELEPDSVVWDIGAGSGSVSIEAARLCPNGHVYAIEKNKEDLDLVEENKKRFGVGNITTLHNKAPAGLETFPDPDRVFIGGSGGELKEILKTVTRRLRPNGIVVLNAITLENSAAALEFFKTAPYEADFTLLQFSRSKPILNLTRYEALNPITIITARKR